MRAMRAILLLASVCPGLAQTFDFNDANVSPTPQPTTQVCMEVCKEFANDRNNVVCACGRDYLSSCHAECAGFRPDEIKPSNCNEYFCRSKGDPCDENSVCTPVRQEIISNKCEGQGYACVQSHKLMACHMNLQNLQPGAQPPYTYRNGVCLSTGGNRYWTVNQCFAEALGLEAVSTPCEKFQHTFSNGTSAMIEPLFFFNSGKGTLNYYYQFTNTTLMQEYGDKILEDTCGCSWDYNPVTATFTEFCLTFWNQCFLDCKRKKYDSRQDSYFKDRNLVIAQGECRDPCASSNNVWPCATDENCYPIKNKARCFKTFDRQYDCMTKNCPGWDSDKPATNPVCVKIYAGVRIDDVYRGGGSVSAYTYRDSCMAQCEGFLPGDWEEGSCSDLAVTSCENTCAGQGGTPVCAEVQVQVQTGNSSSLFGDESDTQISVQYESKFQTIPNECMAECLGWTKFTPGQCQGATVSIDAWTGFDGNKCKDYAKDAGDGTNYREYCSDVCNGKGCQELEDSTINGCMACTECKGSPACPESPSKGFAAYNNGNAQWSTCDTYSATSGFCKKDVHAGADPTYFNQRACDACPQCADNPRCLKGWEGPDGNVCLNYANPTVKKQCHTDYYVGFDPQFIGQRACEACDECRQAPANQACNAPTTGFVGGPTGATCDKYAGNGQKFCKDKHVGLDSNFKGKTACDVCGECNGALPCSVSDVGFVGHKYSTCADYREGGNNRNFCHLDKHEGNDISFFGKTACEACGECSNFWGCTISKTGWFGHKGATCADYGGALGEFCFEDFAVGEDPNFKGKNGCTSCPQCASNIVCNGATGFRGYQRKYQCADYVGEMQKFCRDTHTGDDVNFIGKDACSACSECNGARVCQDEFVSSSGFCEDYAGENQKYCGDKYTGYGPNVPSKFKGQIACDACSECSGAQVCKNEFYSDGLLCKDYADAGNRDFCQYDTHTLQSPLPSGSMFGMTACQACSQCAGAPGC